MSNEAELTDPLRDAIADVIRGMRHEQLYLSKRITGEEFAKNAEPFIECSGQPFDEGGDFICEHCAANHIMRGIQRQRILDKGSGNES